MKDAGYCDHPGVEARCTWVACINGCGLAGIGRCSARGDWTDPHCPAFEAAQPLGMISRLVLGDDPLRDVQP